MKKIEEKITYKNFTLLVLGITALAGARVIFLFLHDPEGPNLLVVAVLAVMIYVVSLVVYVFKLSIHKKFLLAVLIQMIEIQIFIHLLN